MAPSSPQNRGAILALFITITLLFFASWNLYNEPPTVPTYRAIITTNVTGTLPSTKAAAILETRPLNNLVPLILHFSAVLGPQWPIHIFTSSQNRDLFMNSRVFNRKLNSGEIVLRDLPVGVPSDFQFHQPYLFSQFLSQPWLWEQLAPADHVFLFRADSMICSKSEKSLDDFLEYDFIGAALKENDGVSGGLSLRNRSKMLEIAQNSDWQNERHGDRQSDGTLRYEDEARWFWKQLQQLASVEGGPTKANLPSMKTARAFAVDAVWEDQPFGYDQARRWKGDVHEVDEILKWCPEVQLTHAEEVTADT